MIKRWNVYIDQADPVAAMRLSHALRFEKSVNLVSPGDGVLLAEGYGDFLHDHQVDAVFAPGGAGHLAHCLKTRAQPSNSQPSQTQLPRIIAPAPDSVAATEGVSRGGSVVPAGEGFLVDCYTDRTGQLRYCFAQHVEEEGEGLLVTPVEDMPPGLATLADTLNSRIKPWGGWYFRATLKSGGEAQLAEAALVGGVTLGGLDAASLSRLRGANFPALMLFEAMGHDVGFLLQEGLPCTASIRPEGVRAQATEGFDSVFFDLDDTLIVHGQVNPEAINFLQRCRKHQKPVTLITRHYREPAITLAEFAIDPGLFAHVVWLTDGSSKASHIPPGVNAVFIDDAYKERVDVARRAACRVFAPDALPALEGGMMQEVYSH